MSPTIELDIIEITRDRKKEPKVLRPLGKFEVKSDTYKLAQGTELTIEVPKEESSEKVIVVTSRIFSQDKKLQRRKIYLNKEGSFGVSLIGKDKGLRARINQ